MAARQKLAQATPSTFRLKVVLYCTKTEEVEEKVITFESFPATILDIKKQIEKQYSVPVCVQELSYDGHKVKNDSFELSTMKVRNGDTFHIKYLAKGHCSEITNILRLLNSLLTELKDDEPDPDPLALSVIIAHCQGETLLQKLAFKYFYEWPDPNTYVDKLHFAHCNGIEVLMKVYKILLPVPWYDQSYPRLKTTECNILHVLWNFTDTVAFKRLVIENKGIQMCIQSMLRVRLEEGKKIQEIVPLYTPNEQSTLLETIRGAAGVLCNVTDIPANLMSEISKCHMEIASNEEALHQLTCLSTIDGDAAAEYSLPIVGLFICLAFTTETHKYLAKQMFIRRLIHTYQTSNGVEEVLFLKYFTMVFLAQMTLASPHCLPQDYQQEIISEMRSFLQSTCYQTVMELEIQRCYLWCTLLPYVKLVYVPKSSEPMNELQLTSLQLMIFTLQNMLGRGNHREILLKEGLLDYVMCIPQYVPASLRSQAEELVRMVASAPDIPEGPPKLLNLVKACLAKMHFGLEQVLSLSISEIVSKVLPTDMG